MMRSVVVSMKVSRQKPTWPLSAAGGFYAGEKNPEEEEWFFRCGSDAFSIF